MKAHAIVLASGSGQRFDTKDVPKHLTPILGVPILVWTLSTLIKSKLFSSIIVVVRENDIKRTKKVIKEYIFESTPSIKITKGSNERMKSFFLGLQGLDSKDLLKQKRIVGLFDANRPFSPINQIIKLYETASEFGCACPVRPVVNGIAEINAGNIVNVPDKKKYVEYVTPEFIQLDMLNKAIKNNELTLLSSLVEYALSLGVNPSTCGTSILNSKLTFPEDQTYLEGLAIDNDLEIN